MSKKIIGMDIGGTTFSSALFDENLNLLASSDKRMISEIGSTMGLIDALSNQINELSNNQVDGVGVSCPGPLDSKNGAILETPNLKLLQNVNLKRELEKKCSSDVYIENDANLFTWGEWRQQKTSPEVFAGVTLGTGLGFGLMINNKLFTGAHGLATEYAISPLDHGNWETYISISGIQRISKEILGRKIDPKSLCHMAEESDADALQVWNSFGTHLGSALSHFINMVDPGMISIGGGVSKAFKFFDLSMRQSLEINSPSYKCNQIHIFESNHKELSSQIGAALLFLSKQRP